MFGVGDVRFRGNSSYGQGAGDDGFSWGLTNTMKLRHAQHDLPTSLAAPTSGARAKPGEGVFWSANDTIGMEFEISSEKPQRQRVRFYVNGRLVRPNAGNGDAAPPAVTTKDGWLLCDASVGLIPVVSFDAAFTGQLNFGRTPFRHPTPDNANSFQRFIDRVMVQKVIEEAGDNFGKLTALSGENGVMITDFTGELVPQKYSIMPTVVVAGVLLTRGKWYYEMNIIGGGPAQHGWADLEFKPKSIAEKGVGNDKHRYAAPFLMECHFSLQLALLLPLLMYHGCIVGYLASSVVPFLFVLLPELHSWGYNGASGSIVHADDSQTFGGIKWEEGSVLQVSALAPT